MSKLLLIFLTLLVYMTNGWAQESRSAEQIVQNSCATCHGIDGNQPMADFPRLAGQHKDYLEKALGDYIAGRRKDKIMREQVVDVSNGKARFSEQEINAMAEYFSRQSGLFVK
jgi:cytochrome c553